MKKSLLLFAVLPVAMSTILGGCKTDLDVNAPYKEITIVYGLLDQHDDTCWVKINKGFLGSGDAFTYAQIADSNEYTSDQLQDRKVEELNDDGSVNRTYALIEKIVDRDLGIFYGPQHKLYYFKGDEPGWHPDPAHKYRLSANAKGNNISTTTRLVGDMNFTGSSAVISATSKIQFASAPGIYQTYEIKWRSGVNGKRFDLSYQFVYADVSSTDSVVKSFEVPIGTRVSSGTGGGEQLSLSLNGQGFYQSIHSHLTNVDSLVNGTPMDHRTFIGIDLKWAMGGSDLYTYVLLSNPISGIVEDRPSYTNITNGYGIFSSRSFDSVSKHNGGAIKKLQDPSLIELKDGQYTGGLRF